MRKMTTKMASTMDKVSKLTKKEEEAKEDE